MQTVQNLMKCSFMLHFIWVFTVCQGSRLGVSSIQRVNTLILSSYIFVLYFSFHNKFLKDGVDGLSFFHNKELYVPLTSTSRSVVKCTVNTSILFISKCRLLITFAKSLDTDHARQNAGPDLDPNCLTLWSYS